MSTSVAVTDSNMKIINTNSEKSKEIANKNRQYTKQRPERHELKDFFVELDDVLKGMGYLKSRENSIKDINNGDPVKPNVDFYSRLKNIYNKPLTNVRTNVKSHHECCAGKRKVMDAKAFTNGDRKGELNRLRCNIRLMKMVGNEEVSCRYLETMKKSEVNDGKLLDVRLKRKCSGRCFVPDLDQLPDDEEGFGELIESYISPAGSPADGKADGKADEPSSCGCSETVGFSGDSSLGEVDRKIRQLKRNHRTSSVVVRIRKPKDKLEEEVDTREKARFCKKTPIVLTKFGLESICEQIGAHPSLKSLTVEGVPLSAPCQAMLVPSFATLRELRLISNRLCDEGVGRVCRYLWRCVDLRLLDLTGNSVTGLGVRDVVRMVERLAAVRAMGEGHSGLERITLDLNPIGYGGFMDLLNAAGKDLWLRAVDVRGCGLRWEEVAGLDVLDLRTTPEGRTQQEIIL